MKYEVKIDPMILEDYKKVTGKELKLPSIITDEEITAVKTYAKHAESKLKDAEALINEINEVIKSHKEHPDDYSQFALTRLHLKEKAENLHLPKSSSPSASTTFHCFKILNQEVTPQKTAALCTLLPDLTVNEINNIFHGNGLGLRYDYPYNPFSTYLNWYEKGSTSHICLGIKPANDNYTRGYNEFVCGNYVFNTSKSHNINSKFLQSYPSQWCLVALIIKLLLDNDIKYNYTYNDEYKLMGETYKKLKTEGYVDAKDEYIQEIINDSFNEIYHYPKSIFNISDSIKVKKIKKYIGSIEIDHKLLEEEHHEYISTISTYQQINAEKELALFKCGQQLDELINTLTKM